MMPGLLIDVLLAAGTLWVAWRALASADLTVSVVLFITFGLLMSLLWVRIGAEDIAIAEAAIGAGVTGALMLDALRRRRDSGAAPGSPQGGHGAVPAREGQAGWVLAASAFLVLALGSTLLLVLTSLPTSPAGLTAEVIRHLDGSGVAQPVTSVLVNFRGYDTLLEMAVMVLTAIAMLSVRGTRGLSPRGGAPPRNPLLPWLVGLLFPVLILTSFHLLFLGTRGAGGGFQAGALGAAAAIYLLVAGKESVAALPPGSLRAALVGGFGLFLVGATGPLLQGRRFFELGPDPSPGLILWMEAAMAGATVMTLAVLFAGAPPGSGVGDEDPAPFRRGD